MENYWEPCHPFGCGWDECEICGVTIQLLREKEHRAIANRSGPDMREAAPSRAKGRETMRVRRILAPKLRAQALAMIQKRPVMRLYRDLGDGVWLTEVWLELENPSVLCAQKEARESLKVKVNRAVKRAERKLHYAMQNDRRFSLRGDMDRM